MSGSSLAKSANKLTPDQVADVRMIAMGVEPNRLPTTGLAPRAPATAAPAAPPSAAQAYGAPVGPQPGLQPYSQVPPWAYALNQQAMAPLFQAPQAGPAMNPAMLQQGNYASFLRNFLGS